MPAKREVILQHTLSNDGEYHSMLNKDGLTVVDVFARWCGPCKAIAPLFRRLRNELGDDMLRFAVAEADSIEALKEYRGRSEPTFLFVATGEVLVKVIRGANGPLIEKSVLAELKQEHLALEGQVDRNEFNDTFFEELAVLRLAEEAAAEAERNKIVPIRKHLALVVVKPDVPAEQAAEITQKIIDAEFQVLKQKGMTLERDLATDLLSSLADEENFDDHVDLIVSGPCHVLVISKSGKTDGLITDLRELIGPNDIEDAQENNPECLRAEYGRDNIRNAFHLSSSRISAEREIGVVFPKFKAPWVEGTAPETQQAVLVIGPAFLEGKDGILEQLSDANARICRKKEMQLEADDVESLFGDFREQTDVEAIATHMTSAPSLLLLLEHDAVVDLLSSQLGAAVLGEGEERASDSFRHLLAVEGVDSLCLYGSTSLEKAGEEVKRFFPMQQTVALIKPEAFPQKDEILQEIERRGFIIAFQEERQLEEDVVKKLLEEQQETEVFSSLVALMLSGPVEVMILSARDGVQAWNDALGPEDPTEAKELEPTSLRALYGGEDATQNGLHGSATAEHAAREMTLLIAEELQFDESGQVKKDEPAAGEEAGEVAAEGEAAADAAADAEPEAQPAAE